MPDIDWSSLEGVSVWVVAIICGTILIREMLRTLRAWLEKD